MSEKVDIYMPWYIGDWFKDTADLSMEEAGVYSHLLFHMWNRGGSLPLDFDRLARSCRMDRGHFDVVWCELRRFFAVDESAGSITQKRLAAEFHAAKERRAAASENGKLGAAARWQKDGHPNGHPIVSPMATPMANGWQNDGSSPSPSGSPSESDPPSPPTNPETSPSGPLSAEADLSPDADGVREVFAHYRTYHPRAFPAPKAKGQEWRKIRERLREGHTVEDLKAAIDGYHRSPFHCGENDTGAKYLDLELFVRDGSHVAKGIEYAEQRAGPVLGQREKRSVRAGISWLERTGASDAER